MSWTSINKYKLIVAHPDDEILFFNSVLPGAEKVIICYGPSENERVTHGRSHIKGQLPLNDVTFLDIAESNVYGAANWKTPSQTASGLKLKRNNEIYEKKYAELMLRLADEISEGDTIFTHNPWGEYGHEHHVQVFNVIASLKSVKNLNLFVNGYVSDKSYNLMLMRKHLLSKKVFVGYPDISMGQEFVSIYKKNHCWTWVDPYNWPQAEIFIEIGGPQEQTVNRFIPSALPPLNFLYLKSKSENKAPASKLWRKIKGFIGCLPRTSAT